MENEIKATYYFGIDYKLFFIFHNTEWNLLNKTDLGVQEYRIDIVTFIFHLIFILQAELQS